MPPEFVPYTTSPYNTDTPPSIIHPARPMSWDLLQRFLESDVFNQNPFLSVSYLSYVQPSRLGRRSEKKKKKHDTESLTAASDTI